MNKSTVVIISTFVLSLVLVSCSPVKNSVSRSNISSVKVESTISSRTTNDTHASSQTSITSSAVTSTSPITADDNSDNYVIKINDYSIFYNDPLTFQNIFVYNMTSGDSITLTPGKEVWSDTAKKYIFTPDKNVSVSCSKTSDFAIGKNIATITISASNRSAKTYNLVVFKYDALGAVAYNLYSAANKVYWGNEIYGSLFQGSSKEYKNSYGNPLFMITNYQQVMTKYFTPKGQEQFEVSKKSSNSFYRAPNGDVYSESPQRGGGDISNIILIQKTATDTSLTYSVTGCGGDSKSMFEYLHDFTIKKVGSNWFVDDFTLDS